ncbi:DUF4942 domain-containing protein [Pseudomonas tritici]|uniref:DUF4942 domain-containing protein n=1 Tax=Pseudomonas tritici TaxID=2745518 RepID=UPI00387B2FAC
MTAFQTELQSVDAITQVESELVLDDTSNSYQGVAVFDMIDQMLGEYRKREFAIMQAKEVIDEAFKFGVMSYFIDGAKLLYGSDYYCSIPRDAEAAKCCLRVEFWNRLLTASTVFEFMPAAKRKQAKQQFAGSDCPPFDESTVRPTLESLLNARSIFFAERVDGIFRGLSKQHVTNLPSGFSKKMILANVFDQFGCVNGDEAALISDLRGVVGRLTGRGEPSEYGTKKLLARLYNKAMGKKVSIDGGAFYCTVYKRGTMHFEVAPVVAVELNSILATLYPLAIPSRFRTRPKATQQSYFDLKTQRLPMATVDLLAAMEYKFTHYVIYCYQKDESAVDAAISVIESIGGCVSRSKDNYYLWLNFDYEVAEVIDQIVYTGVVPETVSHQFYRTNGSIGAVAAAELEVKPEHTCIEPQAGLGDLAQFLPIGSTVCIEIAHVRAKVLMAKGYNTVHADFLQWAKTQTMRADRILMNPPFSKGRALAHLQAAAGLLASAGRLVAILPASMLNTTPLVGFKHKWSEVFVDQFEGTHVRVVILTATPDN